MYLRYCIVIVALLVLGCTRDDRTAVVVYTSVDEHIAVQVIDAFEKQTGIRVKMVGDTELKKTTGLVERVRAEKDSPRADVFWSSEIFMTVELANEGLFDAHQSETAKDWPAKFRDPNGRWFGFAARARVIVYSPDRVAEDERPTTWMDLTKERYRDRIVMADPRFGTTGGHLGAMKAYWDREVMPGFFGAYAQGLAANRIRLLPSGNAGVVEAVAKGEADLGMTDTDDVWAAQARGLKVELIYPAHALPTPGLTEGKSRVDEEPAPAMGAGTLLIPNTVAKIKGAPHPELAARFIDFLLSEQVERMLADSVSHNIPIRPALAGEFSGGKYVVPNPLGIDYAAAAAARTSAIQQLMKAVDRASTGSGSEESHAR